MLHMLRSGDVPSADTCDVTSSALLWTGRRSASMSKVASDSCVAEIWRALEALAIEEVGGRC